jgi:hypothetical protein
MSVEHWSNGSNRGEEKNGEKTLFQGHRIQQNYHMNATGIEPKLPRWEAGE